MADSSIDDVEKRIAELAPRLRDAMAMVEDQSPEDVNFFIASYLIRHSGVDITSIEHLLTPMATPLNSVLQSRPYDALIPQNPITVPDSILPLSAPVVAARELARKEGRMWKLEYGAEGQQKDVRERTAD